MADTAAATLLDALESLDDAALHEVVRRAEELLESREVSKRREALEQARAILAGAGLSPQDLLGEARFAGARSVGRPAAKGGAAKGSGAKAGARYANPANPAQVYKLGAGRPPKWWTDLKAKGRLPEPLAD